MPAPRTLTSESSGSHCPGVAAPAENLDALRALLESARTLLESAQSLTERLEGDGAVQRVGRALMTLTPEERDVLADVIEHACNGRQVYESLAAMNGVHVHINPNPRLFIRVLESEQAPAVMNFEVEEVVPDVLRLMRRVHLLLRPEAETVWKAAVANAMTLLGDDERDDCLEFVRRVASIIAPDGPGPRGPESGHGGAG